jgi:uncharacterized protein YutE (UPF0331/DUF86 family)
MDTLKVKVTNDTVIILNNQTTSKQTVIESSKYDKGCNDCWSNFCDCKLLSDLIWPLTIFIIIILFYKRIKSLFDSVGERIKKIKVGGFEVELEKKVNDLERLVIAEEIIGGPKKESKETKINWPDYYKEYSDILKSKSSNIEKILRASQLVELMISDAGKDLGLTDNAKLKNPKIIMNELHQHGLITVEEFSLYNEFTSLRNKVIHGQIKEISDSLTTRILDLLWRIVRIFG